jgi:gliding motility-associated-like protein
VSAQFPNATLFNTASNGIGNGTIAIGQNDLNWMAVMTNSLGTYVPAVSCGNQAPGAWINSPFPNANWITYPHNCSPSPAEHSCLGNVDEFYRLVFNLPANGCGGAINTPSAYCLSLDFYADNWLWEVFVNGTSAFLNPNPNPYNAPGFSQGNGLTVSLCNNWQAGSNTVIVHVKSGAPNFPGYTGFLAQVNQTVNTGGFGVPVTATVSQSPSSCSGNNGSASVTASGGVPPYTYTWLPSGGNNSFASNLAPGVYTVIVSGGNCATSNTVAVTQLSSPSFSVTGINTVINCTNSAATFSAFSSYTTGALSYSWSSISFTSGSNPVNISQPGTITVTAYDPNQAGCSSQQTVAVTINTTMPTNTVNPASQSANCYSGSVTFTGTTNNPTVNLQQDWYSPLNPLPGGVPIATSNNTTILLSGNLVPGIYTLQTTNLVNGCKTSKTVTITSLDAWPTFSVASSTNFSVGCNPLNQTTLSIINPISTQTPAATTSYTFLPPGFGGVVSPSIILNPSNTSTVTQLPGTWTLIVQDNSNFCRTQISVPVIQNTIAPQVQAIIPTYTLMCKTPTLLALGSSTTANTIISWNIPSVPPQLPSPTVVIGPGSGPNTSSTSLSYANYTVIATNTLNACQSSSVINIYQNFKPPVSSPTISIGTPTAIYCTAPNHPAVLTTGNSTTTSGPDPLAFVVNPCWAGPSPQTPTCGPSSYSCYIAGVYSLTVEDNYNGCKNTATINILDKTQPPVIANANGTATLDCGANQANLFSAVTGSSTGLMYWYFGYPAGAAFSPTAAPIPNGANIFLSGTPSPSVLVSVAGQYPYAITNTLTGCRSLGTWTVVQGNLDADFSPDSYSGYAPLTVAFTPTNYSGLSNVNNVWSFGNGTSLTNTSSINPSATYTAAGTYTVMLISQKGSCMDTVYKVIKADIPSKLEIPNIFTPNGDGSNDVFFLKTTAMSEIHAVIFDRWGNRVYETSSSTGNILWDGKNLQGKDCAAGVYFYVITSDGKDDKHYEQKGNVSLYR